MHPLGLENIPVHRALMSVADMVDRGLKIVYESEDGVDKSRIIVKETGEVIPDELLDKMIAAKNVNSGTKALQQVYYGVLDFTLHDGYNPDGDKSTTDIVAELQNEITFYPYQDGTHMEAAFGHLNGYGAAYYGYKWSEVYAQDMFSIFEEKGIMNAEQGMRYRKIILEKGGTEEPLTLVKEFLGRESNSDAFMRSMGLEWRNYFPF